MMTAPTWELLSASKKKKNKQTMRFSSLIFLLLFPFLLSAQNNKQSFKIVFYNVENLFDTANDSLTNDNEFTPKGERYWSNKKLNNKINKIAKTILAIGEWNPPDIIGLCEIENSFVLKKLTEHHLLKHLDYRSIHKESPDHRGIDVALLYRKYIFTPEKYNCIPIVTSDNDTLKTREILHIKGKLGTTENLHIFVNHWPSRYGGLMETAPLRKLTAQHVKDAINIVLQEDHRAKIICMGDFNDQPWDSRL